jgi:hypothetical protein
VYLSFHIWLWMTVFPFSIFALWTLDIPFQQNRFRLCFFLCFLICEQWCFFLTCLLVWIISSIFAFENRLCFFLTFFLFELFCLAIHALFLGVAGWMCIVFNVLQGFEASSFQAAATAAKEASHSRAQPTMVSSWWYPSHRIPVCQGNQFPISPCFLARFLSFSLHSSNMR